VSPSKQIIIRHDAKESTDMDVNLQSFLTSALNSILVSRIFGPVRPQKLHQPLNSSSPGHTDKPQPFGQSLY
jgi:hypothetical protein